ncbi:MAG: toll/interleukin-1 receptor domain-containing protein [Pseudonocardiales bacterium]|nr:toll/interleukin-1 receptor domain-containing protein [Pseudonocardiales bacterium]
MGVFEESKGRLKQAIGYIPPDPSPSGAVEIFISYAREDVGMQERLLTHLSRLRRQGVATTWTDREIAPGEKWRSSINARLEAADIILLLVSADFINSDYCWDVEVKRALRRQAEGTARVIPVILRECDWKSLPFGELQAVPQSPISAWSDQDAAFAEVARAIGAVINEVQTSDWSQREA